MGKITSAIKNFRWGYLLIAVTLCTLGVLCFIFQEKFLQTIGYIVGGAVLLFGIILAIKILAERQRGFIFGITLLFSVLTIICGVTSMILNDKVITIYPMFIGLFIVIDGSFKLQTVINAKRYKMKMWWFLLIFSSLTIASGFVLIKDSADNIIRSVIILGIALCLSGLGNLFSLFYFGTIMKRAVIEYKERHGEYKEDALAADMYDNKVIVENEKISMDITDIKSTDSSEAAFQAEILSNSEDENVIDKNNDLPTL
ncbi:MAG: DUF308 domain-containing protein [Clostridia bacterium]|nr:DUF308 domain-containing protein [Clostridia bacterium]